MASVLDLQLAEIPDLCRRYGVAWLELFGSAAGDAFDPQRSDLDFLVEFDADSSMQPKTPKLLEDVRDAAVTLAAEWCRKHPVEGKQPEMTGWAEGTGPWIPVIRALQQEKRPHARTAIVIECCEESGSTDLPACLEALATTHFVKPAMWLGGAPGHRVDLPIAEILLCR